MKNLHPGEYLKQNYLEPMKLSINKASVMVGVTPSTLHRLVVGQSDCSVIMAIKLSKAFGEKPERWLEMQNLYDLKNIVGDFNG